MKSILTALVLTVVLMAFSGCEVLDTLSKDASHISFHTRVPVNGIQRDSLLFRGTAIDSYVNSTGEVVFNDTLAAYYMRKFHKVSCFLGRDSLFSFTVCTTGMSAVVNDLVLTYTADVQRYYFQDGYPLIYTPGAQTRATNKTKRAAAWQRFIDALKAESRYTN